MFGDSVVLFIFFYAAVFLIGTLILWLVIYSAVRAALSSHRQAVARGGQPGRL
ncbi:hypothetical protein [Microbacterium sp. MYb62]|uniref:hypothetical protein n=1 Tax=Microbacterium sp. MYb62 TaxID=1848690 RepID=UPI0015E409C9|nr:hypothetical protein [Microbacterium sp. MYb62]